MRRRMVLLVISLAILSAPGSAAQVATPDPAELPEATAPFGLSGLVLPVTGEEVRALLDRLPDTLGGERRGLAQEEDGRVRVAWGAESMPFGQPITLGVLHFPTSDFFPADFTAGNYVAVTMLTDDAQVAAAGRDGDLVWVWAEISVGAVGPSDATPAAAGTLHTLAWGVPAARGSLPLPPIRRSGSRHLWGRSSRRRMAWRVPHQRRDHPG